MQNVDGMTRASRPAGVEIKKRWKNKRAFNTHTRARLQSRIGAIFLKKRKGKKREKHKRNGSLARTCCLQVYKQTRAHILGYRCVFHSFRRLRRLLFSERTNAKELPRIHSDACMHAPHMGCGRCPAPPSHRGDVICVTMLSIECMHLAGWACWVQAARRLVRMPVD